MSNTLTGVLLTIGIIGFFALLFWGLRAARRSAWRKWHAHWADFRPNVHVNHSNQNLRTFAYVLARDEPRAREYLNPGRTRALLEAIAERKVDMIGNALIMRRPFHPSIKWKPKFIEKKVRALIPSATILDTQDQPPGNRTAFKVEFAGRSWLEPKFEEPED